MVVVVRHTSGPHPSVLYRFEESHIFALNIAISCFTLMILMHQTQSMTLPWFRAWTLQNVPSLPKSSHHEASVGAWANLPLFFEARLDVQLHSSYNPSLPSLHCSRSPTIP
ncbi:hypothetical protein BJX99DRAFT_227801 [Aspergillus californicus]